MPLALPAIERIPGGRAFASLSRRVRTLIVAGVLFVVLFVVALVLPVPYVILSPGPTYNTLGLDPYGRGQSVIMLDGRSVSKTTGHLNMTTVSISSDSISAFQAVAAWLAGDQVVVPETAVRPPGVSQKEQNEQDAQDFQVSQDSATVAALCELGYPRGVTVAQVLHPGPSAGVLQDNDQLVSVAGHPITSAAAVVGIVQSLTPGNTVPVEIKRKGEPVTVQVKLGTPPKGQKGARLGISPADTCVAPFTVSIRLENIGGPSAGLMFALGIIDKAGHQDLTGGKFIAGTGEIDPNHPEQGLVQPIGGIQLKMIAAKRKGASVFLAPAANCGDVRNATPAGLKVIKVSTVRGAVQDLLRIQKGEPVPGC